MRLVASNRSWWRPILLVATGLLGLFPTFGVADDQVWTKAVNLTDNTAFNRSTTNLVLAIHGSALSGLGSSARISLGGSQNVSILGAPGQTVTLNLRNFVLAGNSTFTLEGTATTSFIINVTRRFSLSGSSRIILSSGVLWDHVFFNVLGRRSIVSLSSRAQLYGTLTAIQRTVSMDDYSIVYGAVTARRILLTEYARIILPSIVSP
jgi:hypothetical protein